VIGLLLGVSLLQQAPAQPQPQGPPGTDIWMADLVIRAGRVAIGRPVNVTARPGYDNQPAFLPDGSGFLYTRVGADGQADIWRYDLAAHSARAVTATPESEYSPTIMPKAGGISVVRVELDSTQRLWRLDPDGGHPALLFDKVKPVGYHAWAGDSLLALYVLGNPNALVVARLGSEKFDTVARNIGQALQPIPGRHAVSFVQIADSTRSWLTELNADSGTVHRLVRLPRGAEFHVWIPGGSVLASDGTTLYQWDPKGAATWVVVADLGALGLKSVTRLAVSPASDQLAVVARDPGP
jgi:dipeptidyl aminopeptidase/acylaminoacyl peptidase